MSPLLFIIVMKALGRMISTAMSGRMLSSVGTSFDISHLLLANDTLIFSGVDPAHLQCLFLCFEAILGMKVNLAKSELVPMGNVDGVDGLAGIMGYGVYPFPLKYLGLPLGDSYWPIWNGVIENLSVGWLVGKMMHLSKGVRVTLIKSTFSNLPMYSMSLFPLLAGGATRIEKL